MSKPIMLYLAGLLSLSAVMPAQAGGAADRTVVPCDEPGADPGGSTALDNTTSPCDTGSINDIGNTSVTEPKRSGEQRLPPRSQTRQAPPPHNPNPHPQQQDR
ncbi:MAG TPA: hypothetical protein VEA39_01420 [Methylophilaceae bacterium]|nr:hypothetical protein [Methylophilaceae bacterium]